MNEIENKYTVGNSNKAKSCSLKRAVKCKEREHKLPVLWMKRGHFFSDVKMKRRYEQPYVDKFEIFGEMDTLLNTLYQNWHMEK